MRDLQPSDVVWMNEVQADIYKDESGRVFGVELDLYNNHRNFYIRYPDGTEKTFFTDDVYQAINMFNKERVNGC